MTIRDNADLAIAYSMIKLIKEHPEAPKYNEVINGYKRDIRKYTHRPLPDRRIIHEDGIDGYTALIELPEEITDLESAEEWFEYNERRECAPSIYDCTGQAFTFWHKIIKRRGRFFCYHHICFDV